MKTAPAPSPSSIELPTYELIPAANIKKNPWNVNKMTAPMFAKEIESIQTYGFIIPLVVREIGRNDYQVVDGEHRFDAGTALGMTEFPSINLGLIEVELAQKLGIIINELHGQADPTQMGDLLRSLVDKSGLDDLLVALPYDESVLAGFLTELPVLPPLVESSPKQSAEGATPDQKEPWVERLYRMPKSVALVVDEAIEKARDGEELEPWQGLERVAADYLAG